MSDAGVSHTAEEADVGGAGGGVRGHKRHLSGDGDTSCASPPPSVTSSSRNGGDGDASKKRRTGPGSRGVANLTPEQLAKKRANDREAQRAIRERTKHQIESLERRIQELTSTQPYQELQAVIRSKEAVEAENASLKKHLAWIVSTIQPLLGGSQGPPLDSRVYPSPGQTYLPVQAPPPAAPVPVQPGSTPGSAVSPGPGTIEAQIQWKNPSATGNTAVQTPTFYQAKLLGQQKYELLHGLDLGPERLGLDFLLDASQQITRIQPGQNGAQDSPEYHHAPMRHDATYPGASASPPEGTATDMSPRTAMSHPGGDHNVRRWATPLNHCPPTCPLDHLLLDFLSERRQRAAEGLSTQEIIGPRYPSVSSLLNPQNSRFSHPLSKVFTDILATFPDISRLPERVAVLYIMFLIMRWQINPSRESYERLPPWCRPCRAQHAVPHPAWIDHLPFPIMRERLVHDFADGSLSPELFDDFFVPFTQTLSLNWPYEDTDTLLQSPEGEELMINPVFERHLRRQENWTLGEAFDKAFPLLADMYNLKKDSGAIVLAKGKAVVA
ncbi:uncharacterized protein E0L32_008070 [Thyridium curvatum]|uniref:BZIP transcription factor n=1 Tax=Thyridium curvatum TaxID=1093900 RepID=A0A507ATG3_9PEZI|nr:uncharacterized protein E0L32_008070 [Thyridium curvatum]TPX11033.1 hypothetical protein E0L32_008070 [Thyridium curvatum]